MLRQYPHTIILTTNSGGSEDPNTGNWIPGTTTTETLACRAEINSSNGFVVGPNGTQIRYDWTVYMPLPQPTVAPGTLVEIKNGSEVLYKSTIKQMSVGQLNARIWL